MFKTKMYLSGSLKGKDIDDHILYSGSHRLFTYAYAKEGIEFLNYANSIGVKGSFMFDSGAFSAWNSGRAFKVEELIEYDKFIINNYGDHHDMVFIALDVIPGTRTRAADNVEIRKAMDESYDNYLLMQQELNRPVLPVFHSGEGTWHRDRYLAKTDHICLSMIQTLSNEERAAWAREAHVPGTKMHGLAATGNSMMNSIDWYSVDSSTWLMSAGMGAIFVPTADGKGMRTLAISSESPTRHVANSHYDNLYNKAPVEKMIRDAGFDPERLRTEYRIRMHWNIEMWRNPPWTKEIIKAGTLFDLQ